MMLGTIGSTKRVIIYIRVSTDEQVGNNSLPVQEADCRRYAEQFGWMVVAVVSDDFTGTKLDRPGLNQVRELIRQGQVDVLLVHAMDRLTRSLAHLLVLRDEFTTAGIELHYCNRGQAGETPSAVLLDNIEAVIAEYERVRILQRTADGRRGKVQSGKMPGNGPAPYGYRYVGRKRERVIQIDEEEAVIVRLIFTWYVLGEDDSGPLTTTQIAQRLHARSEPTRADKTGHPGKRQGFARWHPETIRNILHETAYKGTFRAYQYRKEAGRDRRREEREREDWMNVPVPALVNTELWDAAQKRLARNLKMSPRNSTPDRYLLRCTMTCNACAVEGEKKYTWLGLRRSPSGNGYYGCAGRHKRYQRTRRCEMPFVRADLMERIVWDWLEREVLDPAALEEGLRQYREQADATRQAAQTEIERLGQERAQVEIELDRVFYLFRKGSVDEGRYEQARVELLAVGQRLDEEITQRRARINHLADDQIDSLVAFARAIKEELHTLDGAERRRVIELLNVRGTMELENGKPVAVVVCTLHPEGKRLTVEPSITPSIPPD